MRNLLVGQGQPIECRMNPDLVTTVDDSAGVKIDGSDHDLDCVAELSICAGRRRQNPPIIEDRAATEVNVVERSQRSHMRHLTQSDTAAANNSGFGILDER